jgi:solute carrier family 20 (sodium-dependent phosphate transporter)
MGAMCFAAVMEFSGAVGVGSRVAETVKSKIVKPELFAGDEKIPVLMLVMVFAVMASSMTLTVATKFGFPVSTTHTLMGGIIGAGIATVGAANINWLENGTINAGVVQIFMSWIIGPFMSAAFAAIVFTITSQAVLVRKNPLRKGLFAIPHFFGFTAAMIVLLLTFKGGSIKEGMSTTGSIIAAIATGIGFSAITAAFLVPWLYRVLVRDDWQLKWYEIIKGPFLLQRKGWTAPPPGHKSRVPNYYAGFANKEDMDLQVQQTAVGETSPQIRSLRFERPSSRASDMEAQKQMPIHRETTAYAPTRTTQPRKSMIGPKPFGPWHSGPVMWWSIKWAFLRGVDIDIFELQREKQAEDREKARQKWEKERLRKAQSGMPDDGAAPFFDKPDHMDTVHASAKRYPNEVEYLFAPVQIMSSCIASFVHGANDVSKSVLYLPTETHRGRELTETVPLLHLPSFTKSGATPTSSRDPTASLRPAVRFPRGSCQFSSAVAFILPSLDFD